LYRYYIPTESKVFFKVTNNIKPERNWSYWCAPDVDVIEVKIDKTIIAYEIKGMRKGRNSNTSLLNEIPPEYPSFYNGIGQALAYLNLPYIVKKNPIINTTYYDKFEGGAFDLIYFIYPRDKKDNFPEYEKRIFDLLPIGVIITTSNGEFSIVKEALKNPIQSRKSKEHLLNNISTLQKFSINSRIFRRIREKGEQYFANDELKIN